MLSHPVVSPCYLTCRFDPARHAAPTPMNKAVLSGRRERAVIAKENNFSQPGARFRSWDPARQERFISRMSGIWLESAALRWGEGGGPLPSSVCGCFICLFICPSGFLFVCVSGLLSGVPSVGVS